MATYRELITNAMKALGVLHTGETPSANESTEALDVLNEMLNSWIYEGIDLEHVTATSLNDAFPYPDDHLGPVRYNLAVRLAPEYGIAVTPALAMLAQNGYDQLRRQYLDNRELSADSALHPSYNPNRHPEWI